MLPQTIYGEAEMLVGFRQLLVSTPACPVRALPEHPLSFAYQSPSLLMSPP